MFLTASVKPVKATLLPNLLIYRKFIKCFCLDRNVPSSLVDLVLDLAPITILSKGLRVTLDSGGTSSKSSVEEIPDVIYLNKELKGNLCKHVR